MALARTLAVALVGVTGRLVTVEAHVGGGLPGFTLVGLPDTALAESRDRVRAAVLNARRPWPQHRITVNLSPASLPKAGAHFDLSIALAVLAADGTIPAAPLAGTVVLGELGLDGRVRPVRGVLPAVLAAAAAGVERVVVPCGNTREARLVPGVEVVPVVSLRALTGWLLGEPPEPAEPPEPGESPGPGRSGGPGGPIQAGGGTSAAGLDLADVLGQTEGRYAVEVCAAGGHHLALVGPPGAGKTMLAERLPGLLPPLPRPAALEVTAVHSLAGALPPDEPLVERAPYAAPHHTATQAAMVGGGSTVPRPGAVSLAHRGVLFLDEAPEFQRSVLDALRQPLESGEVVVSRAAATVRFPARFQLVLAANPCPCGAAGSGDTSCRCTPYARIRYLGKLSGPLLDRVDVRVEVRPVERAALLADRDLVEGSDVVAARVAEARRRAAARLRGTPWQVNGEVPGHELRRRWPPAPGATRALERALLAGSLSARGADRVMRVAWTLADLGGRQRPGADDVHAALSLRLSSAVAA